MSPKTISPRASAYPLVTRRQVLERLEHDAAFVRECITLLHGRYVDRDILAPPAGWMASHRKAGEAAYQALSRADCSDVDVANAASLAKRYAKQITKVLREDQLASDPRLGLAAAVFGVRRADQEVHLVDDGADPYGDVEPADGEVGGATPDDHDPNRRHAVATPSDLGEIPPPRRRPGRPKGSKNKAKALPVSSRPAKRRRP